MIATNQGLIFSMLRIRRLITYPGSGYGLYFMKYTKNTKPWKNEQIEFNKKNQTLNYMSNVTIYFVCTTIHIINTFAHSYQRKYSLYFQTSHLSHHPSTPFRTLNTFTPTHIFNIHTNAYSHTRLWTLAFKLQCSNTWTDHKHTHSQC